MPLFKKFDYKSLGIGMILILALVTIISTLLSTYSDIPQLKIGSAWLILGISTFLIYLFIFAADGRIDRKEIITMVFIALALAGIIFVLKSYVPGIYSAFPNQLKSVFNSALGG